MAVDANSTIIQVIGGGSIDKKDIAVMSANGGIAVYETDKNIYVNAVKEEFLNQRVEKIYSNITQSNTTINNFPGGTSPGEIQFYKISNGIAVFGGAPELKFGYSNATSSWELAVVGNTKSSNLVATNSISSPNVNVSDTLGVTTTLNVGTSTSGNVVLNGSKITSTGIVDMYGNVELGNLTVGNTGNTRTATVTGNLTAANTNAGNLLTANYVHATLTTESNAQPNVTSVSTVLTVGNVLIEGNTVSPQIIANNHPFSIGAYSPNNSGVTYLLSVETDGNINFPVANTGTTVLTSVDDIVIKSGSSNFILYANGESNLNSNVSANKFTGNIEGNTATFSGNVTIDGVAKFSANIDATDINTSGNIIANSEIKAPNIGNLTTSNFFGNVANFANINTSGKIESNTTVKAVDIEATGNITVTGNLYVQGNTSYVNVENLNVQDTIISMGGTANGEAASTTGDRGLWLRYSGADKFVGWDNANTRFMVASTVTMDGTNSAIATSVLGDIAANNFIGTISGTASGLASGNSNVTVTANGNVTTYIAGNTTARFTVTDSGANLTGTANITSNVDVGNNVNVTGNVNVGGQINGDGTSLTAAQGTSNVVITNDGDITFAAAGNSARFTVTGDGASAVKLDVIGNVTAANLVGDLANGNSKIMIASNGIISLISGTNTIATVSNTTFTVSGNTALANVTSTANVTAVNFIGTLANGTSTITIDQDDIILLTSAGVDTFSISGGNANIIGNLDISDTLTAGNFAVDSINIGNAITTNATTFNLVNTTVTTAYFAGDATSIAIGATTGTLTINNPTVVGSQTTQDLFNTVATTLNIGGAATSLVLSATTGTTQIRNDLQVDGDVQVRGGDITTNSTGTFNIVNANAATINIGGAANTIGIGSGNSTITAANALTVTANLTANNANITNHLNVANTANVAKLNANGNVSFTGANVSLGNVSNLHIMNGTANGQFLKVTDYSNGNTAWANVSWSDLATNEASSRGPNSIALGYSATAGTTGIAIGQGAAAGATDITIGVNAGSGGALVAGSIEINTSGTSVPATATSKGFYVDPVRNATDDAANALFAGSLVYNLSTREIGYSTGGVPSADFATRAGLLAPFGNTTSNVTVVAGGNVTITSGGNSTVQVSTTAATITGNLTVTGVNLLANSATTANLGNAVTANFFIGDGTHLTNIPSSSVGANVTSAITANYANFAGTVVTATQGNITSAANLVTVGNVTTGTWSADIGEVSGANLLAVNIANIADALTFTGPVTNNGVALDAANVGTIDITINGTTYTLYAVPKV
jgi:hypothetical protein